MYRGRKLVAPLHVGRAELPPQVLSGQDGLVQRRVLLVDASGQRLREGLEERVRGEGSGGRVRGPATASAVRGQAQEQRASMTASLCGPVKKGMERRGAAAEALPAGGFITRWTVERHRPLVHTCRPGPPIQAAVWPLAAVECVHAGVCLPVECGECARGSVCGAGVCVWCGSVCVPRLVQVSDVDDEAAAHGLEGVPVPGAELDLRTWRGQVRGACGVRRERPRKCLGSV